MMFGPQIAMVGSENNNGIIQQPILFEVVYEPANVVIYTLDIPKYCDWSIATFFCLAAQEGMPSLGLL